MKKIFVWEKIEVTRHSEVPIVPHIEVVWYLQKNKIVVKPADSTQKAMMMKRVRFKVTTCLYLNPNNRARTLSTLIAVSVNKDDKAKTVVVAENATAT